jgi:hypothetical protein
MLQPIANRARTSAPWQPHAGCHRDYHRTA